MRGESKAPGKTEVMRDVPGQAEKSSQQVWIWSSDITKLTPTAVIPGWSGNRRNVKVLKCKPRSQVSRSDSESTGHISRYGSTVVQSAAKDKSLSSNFSAEERGGYCFSQQSGMRLCSCAIPALQHK